MDNSVTIIGLSVLGFIVFNLIRESRAKVLRMRELELEGRRWKLRSGIAATQKEIDKITEELGGETVDFRNKLKEYREQKAKQAEKEGRYANIPNDDSNK